MLLYAVTKGVYSDYHIITLTTDKERAKKIAERFSDKYETADVEEYEDSDFLLKSLYEVTFTPSNTCIKKLKKEYEFLDSYGSPYKINTCTECWWKNKNDYKLTIIVETDNETSAIKIAAEKRAEYMAHKYGI